jgi:hypothetical protein
LTAEFAGAACFVSINLVFRDVMACIEIDCHVEM